LVLGHLSGSDKPTVIERFLQEKHEVVSLKQANSRCGSLNDWSDFFMVETVHNLTDFAKRSAPIGEFPQHAVHLIKGTTQLARCPEQSSHPTFDTSECFGDSDHDFSTAHTA
tara:strand:+ start:2833 stop:3168 length:336 start_codon:yes stop_codon:yes gene_type:complete